MASVLSYRKDWMRCAQLLLMFVGPLGPPVVPFLTPFLGEGSPTKIDYREKDTLMNIISTSLPEDPVHISSEGYCASHDALRQL